MNPIQAVARRRLAWAGAGALLGCVAVAVRLVGTAGFQHRAWMAEAEKQQQRTVKLVAERGALLDCEERSLAVSVPAWSAYADPSTFATPAERRSAAHRLAAALGIDEEALRQRLEQPRYFVWVQRKLSPRQAADVRALGIPGVAFVKESRRTYPQGDLAASVLGTVGMDDSGLDGLEHARESDVAGVPGLLLTMRDARGGGFLPEGLSDVPPQRGSDVVLALDSVIQHVAERELRAALARTQAKAGTVIVMFPGNGEIAALSNIPTFNPNNFPTHPSHLRTNRAVASCYEPGSTLKMFTVAAALEARKVRPDDVIDCGNGSVRVGATRIRDHHSFDRLTVAEVIAQSSNIGAIQIGRAVGAANLHDTLVRFGFGRRTGIELPGESAGLLAPLKDWTPLSLASISFGQEIGVTPLQLATAASAIANGGMLYPPRLVREVRRADGAARLPAARGRRVLSEQTARTMTRLLVGVVDHGTGRLAAVPGYTVAGKTGTAQKIGADGTYAPDRFVASFVGWVPATDPALLALVVLDEPRGEFYGGEVAAPVFAALARDVLRYLEIPPEIPGHELAAEEGADAL